LSFGASSVALKHLCRLGLYSFF